MRPKRLELEGFTSFKERAEIDFEGSEFFALVGATGSGKSSVIDAICFALYGSVPRYENRNLVAPVISHGKVEAKVRLDFSIDGKDFTAVRVVKRSGKGATTKEARLESGGEVLAATADELTDEVTRLVGLSFDHFTRCVVLPQGEFARFLHDKPGERQDLVVKLLNLGIYDRMKQAASARANDRKFALAQAEQKLEGDLAFATTESLAEAKARAKRLGDLRKKVADAKPRLDAAETAAKAARATAQEKAKWVQLVSGMAVPAGIDELAERVVEATGSVKSIEKQVAAARKAVEKASAARKKLGDRAPLEAAVAAHGRNERLTSKLGPARTFVATAEEAEKKAGEGLTTAEAAVAAAEASKSEIERLHAAQHVAEDLEAGKPCPVCLQPVGKLPKHPKVPALDEANATLESARRAATEARTALQKAATAHAKARSDLEALEEQALELERELSDHGDLAAVQKRLAALDAADAALDEARDEEDALRSEADDAREALAALQQIETKERARFEAQRDRVAQLGPPPAARSSLASDWRDLAEWGATRAAELAEESTEADAEATKAEDERERIVDGLLAACTECELEVARDDDPLEAVVEAQAEAKAEVTDITAAIEEAKALRRATKTLAIEAETADQLALHLSARPGRFESWLVNAALRRLVEGATAILNQLSNGQYSLTVDEYGAFQVVDRHNADETRSAKTLSGGETFLASLSLALALADQLADLASEGAASLEAIFLDEGFGTLDPETLDTVAATVENLAESGRMVGIVTHVRELAERIDVQFRVRKDLRTSTVERVVAGV